MSAILPGSTIGVIGGGQLARMIGMEARRMGYRVLVLDPDPECAASAVADDVIVAPFDDMKAARSLAKRSQVLTLDTEHVPSEVVQNTQQFCPARPAASVLATIQDRFLQRRFLDRLRAPQPAHEEVGDAAALGAAAERIGYPCVLKSRRAGYDGRGQARIDSPADVTRAWQAIGGKPAVLEEFVHFEKEISIIMARSADGRMAFFPVAENIHRRHILHATLAPAGIDESVAAGARTIAAAIADALGHVGTMAVEFFLLRDASLLVNEIAPRTHNSGHFTLDCCATSQFEQHLRAVCGLPFGDASLVTPAVMVNLLGDLWADGAPRWEHALAHSQVRLHLYEKKTPAPGRKMGHMVIPSHDPARALALGESILAGLRGLPAPG